MAVSLPGKISSARYNIAYLTTSIGDDNGRLLWSGMVEQAQAYSASLVSYLGGALVSAEHFDREANLLFEMVDKERIDGLIVWASSMGAFLDPSVMEVFCERFRPVPMVAIGMPLPGIPSVVLNSYASMHEAVEHLIKVHGRRRIAYIRGPAQHREANERYRAYCDALAENGIPFDPDLVTPNGNWYEEDGFSGVRLLYEERGARFDALAGTNDSLVAGGINFLRGRGLEVPRDVSVVGFDNIPFYRAMTPPMTSVPIRMRERGRQAVRLLVAQIEGQSVPEVVMLPTRLIVRQSCGCQDPHVIEAGRPVGGPAGENLPEELRSVIIAEMQRAVASADYPADWAERLFDAYQSSLNGPDGSVFLTRLNAVLSQAAADGADLLEWQSAFTTLRRLVLPFHSKSAEERERAESLLHQARVMAGEMAVRAQSSREQRSMRHLSALHTLRHTLSAAETLDQLVEALSHHVPTLGIERGFMYLYLDPLRPLDGARLVLAFDRNGRRAEQEGAIYSPTRQALNGLYTMGEAPINLVTDPLIFGGEQLGFIVLDGKNFNGSGHQVLVELIASALKSVKLIEQNLHLYHQAREAQRLAEEADLLKSRFLSMVSHELLTPMVLLVGLSEMMLREGIGDRPPLPEAYRQDLTRLHAGAQQLGSLVRDVLDLARSQMKTLKLTKRPISLGEVMQPVRLVGEQMTRSKGLEWRVVMPEVMPRVMGDAARLQQVALNLVSNAVKFTIRGWVELRVQVEGDDVRVTVSDTGLGVPAAEQEAIFDEFRQSERTVARGYGGLGIGLAICRRLVEMHGGAIGVQSSGEENGGSSFYFTLPVLVEVETAAPPAHSQVVLILADRAERGQTLAQRLMGEGFQVEVVGIDETPGWLEKLLGTPPGAVLLDLPAIERGWELLDTLKTNAATHDLPVIFYSLLAGQAGGSVLEVDLVNKPVAITALAQALQRYGVAGGDCGDPRSVLVVDDDPAILDLHARLVAERLPECRVMRATNGRQALELMRARPPALVLLDLMMPELDGTGVLKAMQDDERLRGIPVIVVTAQTLTQDEMKIFNQGVAAVLSKGVFTPEETMTHIEQALARSKRLGSEAQRLVRKVMATIHERYADPLTREELAETAGVSERHLNRCFLQETGLAPMAYLNRYRIQRARVLLEKGQGSITEIMGITGFSDSSYFTRVFRRETGVTPSEYQKGKRAG